jgi:hypothetical protein
MRTKIALAAGVALGASFLPISPASAVCVTAWQTLTGQCSPCTTLGPVVRTLHDKYGIDVDLNCLA